MEFAKEFTNLLLTFIRILLSSNFDREFLRPVIYACPLIMLIAYFLTIRKVVKISESLESSLRRKILTVLVLTANFLFKTILIVSILTLLAKPYMIREEVVSIDETSVSEYSSKGILFVILIDSSHSMMEKVGERTRFEIAKEIATRIVKESTEVDEVCVAFFSGNITSYGLGNASKRDVILFIKNFNKTSDYTSIGDAIFHAISIANLEKKPTAIILITDGGNNGGANPLEAAKQLKELNYTFAAIYVGDGPYSNKLLLKKIVKEAGGSFYEAGNLDLSELKNLAKIVSQKAKFTALIRAGELKTVVPVKDYDTPREVLVKVALAAFFLMLLTGV